MGFYARRVDVWWPDRGCHEPRFFALLGCDHCEGEWEQRIANRLLSIHINVGLPLALEQVRQEAMDLGGWRRTEEGWYCPLCWERRRWLAAYHKVRTSYRHLPLSPAELAGFLALEGVAGAPDTSGSG